MTDKRVLWKVFDMALKDAGLDVPKAEFPLILRKGRNEEGKAFWFYLNYSPEVQRAVHEGILARDIFTKEQVDGGGTFEVKGWDLRILAES
jgi:beta-galactosidase